MNRKGPTPDAFDFEKTRTHILTAGRELLLAARGALQFCYNYVESTGTSTPHVRRFFKKAMIVADDLSSGLKDTDAIKRAASSAIKPVFTTMEKEMKSKHTKTKRTRKCHRNR